MRCYKMESTKIQKLEKMVCNCCKKEIRTADGEPREGVFSVNYEWGYFSEKDGETHSFDLCEACYDKWIAGFQIPIEIEEK